MSIARGLKDSYSLINTQMKNISSHGLPCTTPLITAKCQNVKIGHFTVFFNLSGRKDNFWNLEGVGGTVHTLWRKTRGGKDFVGEDRGMFSAASLTNLPKHNFQTVI